MKLSKIQKDTLLSILKIIKRIKKQYNTNHIYIEIVQDAIINFIPKNKDYLKRLKKFQLKIEQSENPYMAIKAIPRYEPLIYEVCEKLGKIDSAQYHEIGPSNLIASVLYALKKKDFKKDVAGILNNSDDSVELVLTDYNSWWMPQYSKDKKMEMLQVDPSQGSDISDYKYVFLTKDEKKFIKQYVKTSLYCKSTLNLPFISYVIVTSVIPKLFFIKTHFSEFKKILNDIYDDENITDTRFDDITKIIEKILNPDNSTECIYSDMTTPIFTRYVFSVIVFIRFRGGSELIKSYLDTLKQNKNISKDALLPLYKKAVSKVIDNHKADPVYIIDDHQSLSFTVYGFNKVINFAAKCELDTEQCSTTGITVGKNVKDGVKFNMVFKDDVINWIMNNASDNQKFTLITSEEDKSFITNILEMIDKISIGDISISSISLVINEILGMDVNIMLDFNTHEQIEFMKKVIKISKQMGVKLCKKCVSKTSMCKECTKTSLFNRISNGTGEDGFKTISMAAWFHNNFILQDGEITTFKKYTERITYIYNYKLIDDVDSVYIKALAHTLEILSGGIFIIDNNLINKAVKLLVTSPYQGQDKTINMEKCKNLLDRGLHTEYVTSKDVNPSFVSAVNTIKDACLVSNSQKMLIFRVGLFDLIDGSEIIS